MPSEVVPHRPPRVALIAHNRPWPELGPSAAGALDRTPPHQLAERSLLVAMPRRQHKRHRPAAAVAPDVQLAAEPAAAAAQRLAEPPPFAPAAQRCARTLVPSIICTSQSMPPAA